jgi:hypothetical protein
MTPSDLQDLIDRPQEPQWRAVDHIPPQVLDRRVQRGLMGYENFAAPGAMPDYVLVKRCPACEEHWPADTEFFARCSKSPDGLLSLCKGCAQEARRRRRGR